MDNNQGVHPPLTYRVLHSRWGRWILFVLGWAILSLLFVPETYLFFLYRGDAIPWTRTMALTLANAGIAFLFIPPIVWLTRRFPLEQRTWRRPVLVHIPACLVFSLSHSWLYAALCYASQGLFHMLFIRFHERLTLVVDVSPEALDAMVPSMLLQPLAENSIRHGFAARESAGTIKIEANRHGGRLILNVLDDGLGFPKQTLADVSAGLGLLNTQRRLEQLYRGAYRFELQ